MSRKILEITELDAKPTPLVEIITLLAIEEGWTSHRAEAREKAEAWHDATLIHLENEVSRLSQIGRPVRIDFNSSSRYLIQGSCFIEPNESDYAKEAKRRRLQATAYSKQFQAISPTGLEMLCGRLLELFGVENPIVTRRVADEGIDFYGNLHLESMFFPQDLMPTIQRQLRIWLVGQAKHHLKTQSGTDEIRDLVGALALGRAGAFGSKSPPFEELDIRVGDPVFAMLITTGTVSSNAWRLMKRSGVIGIDGQMLAAFLADREVAQKDGEFSRDLFFEWLHQES